MSNANEQQLIHVETRRAFFNQAATSWDNRFCNQDLTSNLMTLIPKFRIRYGEKILDVGAGTGVLIPHLIRAVGSSGLVVAVDYANKMTQICNKKHCQLSNVMVGVQTVEKLGFLHESFDAITCFGLFPHIENKQKGLREMNKVLKQGGRLIIAHALSSKEIDLHHHNASLAVAHDALPEEGKMRDLLRNTGFTMTYLKDEPGCYICIAAKNRESQLTDLN